jgi:hypothetical protein
MALLAEGVDALLHRRMYTQDAEVEDPGLEPNAEPRVALVDDARRAVPDGAISEADLELDEIAPGWKRGVGRADGDARARDIEHGEGAVRDAVADEAAGEIERQLGRGEARGTEPYRAPARAGEVGMSGRWARGSRGGS